MQQGYKSIQNWMYWSPGLLTHVASRVMGIGAFISIYKVRSKVAAMFVLKVIGENRSNLTKAWLSSISSTHLVQQLIP